MHDSMARSDAEPHCAPFGEASRPLWVIGHDPRLQRSAAEARVAFFLDSLLAPPPSDEAELVKYSLAKALIDYLSMLIGRRVELEELYVTNLCNRFLHHPGNGKTVLIPDDIANVSIAELSRLASTVAPKLILPMSHQVMYHLARTAFVKASASFLAGSIPIPSEARVGAYKPSKRGAFLETCGKLYMHQERCPVIPILHVRSWSGSDDFGAYGEAMKSATLQIRSVYE